MRTVMPISETAYAACVERLEAEQPEESTCLKCGMVAVPFFSGCCWLCCHADNPRFGLYTPRVNEVKEAMERRENALQKMKAWVGREVIFRTNTTMVTSTYERGVVLKITDGLKSGMRFCIRSHVTGKQCYRQIGYVKLVKTEDADVLQPTA